MMDSANQFIVRYSGGFAIRFEAGRVRSVVDKEATKFPDEESAREAIKTAKLRPATVEIEPVEGGPHAP